MRRFILKIVKLLERAVVSLCICAALGLCIATTLIPAHQSNPGSIQSPLNDPSHLRSSNLRKWV